jgi:16S rRNA processing protein RimM
LTAKPTDRVLIAAVAGPHGVRGLVKLKCFTEDPARVTAYGPLTDETGAREFRIAVLGTVKGGVLARIEGVADRSAAEALKGTRLYVSRSALPGLVGEDEYYHADLVGLGVETRDGRPLGRVKAVLNYGAGDVLEVERGGAPTLLLPFTRASVPVVDLPGRRLVADPPVEVEP